VLLDRSEQCQITYTDITMLAGDMSLDKVNIPSNHPDVRNFVSSPVFGEETFDLVFCDGPGYGRT
jgi:hypothetical protein